MLIRRAGPLDGRVVDIRTGTRIGEVAASLTEQPGRRCSTPPAAR